MLTGTKPPGERQRLSLIPGFSVKMSFMGENQACLHMWELRKWEKKTDQIHFTVKLTYMFMQQVMLQHSFDVWIKARK